MIDSDTFIGMNNLIILRYKSKYTFGIMFNQHASHSSLCGECKQQQQKEHVTIDTLYYLSLINPKSVFQLEATIGEDERERQSIKKIIKILPFSWKIPIILNVSIFIEFLLSFFFSLLGVISALSNLIDIVSVVRLMCLILAHDLSFFFLLSLFTSFHNVRCNEEH